MRAAILVKAVMALSVIAATLVTSPMALGQSTDGTGIFVPSTGLFCGAGDGNLLDERFFSGAIEVEPLDFSELTKPLNFKNLGRDTTSEKFQEIITRDGSSLSLRFEGVVQLKPVGVALKAELKIRRFPAICLLPKNVVHSTTASNERCLANTATQSIACPFPATAAFWHPSGKIYTWSCNRQRPRTRFGGARRHTKRAPTDDYAASS